MQAWIDDGPLGLMVIGAGFLLPLAIWHYAKRRYAAASLCATIPFWATLPQLVALTGALWFNMEDHGAPLRAGWFPPTPALAALLYPPFAIFAALAIRSSARRALEEEERARWEDLAEFSGVPLPVTTDGKRSA
jgi:hypothetical protein